MAGSGPVTVHDERAEYQRLIKWICEANMEIQGKWTNWKFLWAEGKFITEADKIRYKPSHELPSDVRVYRENSFSCNDTLLRQLDWISIKSFDAREYDYGDPTLIAVMPDNSLKIYPTPDKPYTVIFEYYKKPQILRENHDVPWIPETWHKLIVYRAMMMYGDYENAPEKKMAGMEGYASIMPQMEADQLPGQDPMAISNEYNIVVETD